MEIPKLPHYPPPPLAKAPQITTADPPNRLITEYHVPFSFLEILRILRAAFLILVSIWSAIIAPDLIGSVHIHNLFFLIFYRVVVLGFLVFLLYSLWVSLRLYLNRASQLKVYTDGFVLIKNNTVVEFPWNMIVSVLQARTEWYVKGRLISRVLVTICRSDGRTVQVDSLFTNIEDFCERLDRELTRAFLPKVLERYQAGAIIQFGTLSVSQEGMRHRNELLPWPLVKEVAVNRLTITVWKMDQWFRWAQVPTSKTPNAAVLKSLLDHLAR